MNETIRAHRKVTEVSGIQPKLPIGNYNSIKPDDAASAF
uniref:Uncharacterized protein n=1 Tax=Arundo donax TaxID=35708 RepID=A0A0A8Y5V2_ARUDO